MDSTAEKSASVIARLRRSPPLRPPAVSASSSASKNSSRSPSRSSTPDPTTGFPPLAARFFSAFSTRARCLASAAPRSAASKSRIGPYAACLHSSFRSLPLYRSVARAIWNTGASGAGPRNPGANGSLRRMTLRMSTLCA